MRTRKKLSPSKVFSCKKFRVHINSKLQIPFHHFLRQIKSQQSNVKRDRRTNKQTKICLQIFTSNRVTNKRSILLSKQPASLVGSGLLAASLLSLSCTPDTTVNIMLKILLLAMLILVVVLLCLFSLFLHPGHHAYRDVSDVVDNVEIHYLMTFFLGCISSLSHTLHTTLVMMLLGVRLSLDTEHTRSGCPWDGKLGLLLLLLPTSRCPLFYPTFVARRLSKSCSLTL